MEKWEAGATYSRHLPKIYLKVNNFTHYIYFSVYYKTRFSSLYLNLYNKFEMNAEDCKYSVYWANVEYEYFQFFIFFTLSF
jgi:hypothetical protein